MTHEELEKIADEAKLAGNNDLAIVLYVYLGADKLGISSEFARYCQAYARKGVEDIERFKNRGNN